MYEIRIYTTQSDYDNRRPVHILEGLETKEGALDEGRMWLSDHEIVKVQSDDREFIEVLRY